MESFENYRPKLKPGKIRRETDRVIFELQNPYRTVILPADSDVLLNRFDGTSSVSDILKAVCNEQGHVHFRSLVFTLDRLKKFECLENGESLPERADHWEENLSARVHGLTEPFFSIPLFEKMSLKKPVKPVFYLLACAILADVGLLAATAQGPLIPPSFLNVRGSYLLGLVFFIAAASTLISFKNVVKTGLLLFLNGHVVRGSLKANLFSFAYRIEDEATMMNLTKLEAVIYTLTSVGAPFFLAAVAKTSPFSAAADLLPIALVFTVVDTDPYVGSEFTRLFKRLYAGQSLSELVPYLRKKALSAFFKNESKLENELLFTLFSTLTIVWTYAALLFFGKAVTALLSHLTAALVSGSIGDKIGAALMLAGIGLVNFYLIADLLSLVFSNFIHPFRNQWLSLRRERAGKTENLGAAELHTALERISLFTGLDKVFAARLFEQVQVRTFKPGTHIIIQNTLATKMYILLEGTVDIVKREASGFNRHLTQLTAPTVFGEIGVLEGGLRTADVVANTPVKVAFVHKSVLNDMQKGEHGDETSRLLSRIMLQQYLASSSLFADLPKEAIRVFTNAGTFKELPSGHTLFEQGETGDSFYLLVRGAVDVVINKIHVQKITEGGFFGEIALLTNSPRNATIRTTEPSVVFRIDRGAFWKIATENMNLALCIEKVAEQRIQEDARVLAG